MAFNLKKTFVKRVENELLKRGENHSWLAYRTGISHAMLSRYLDESKTSLPPLERLRMICSVLDVTSDYLLGLPEPVIPSSISELFDHAKNAKSSILGTHYALLSQEIHQWEQGEAKKYLDINIECVSKSINVERIFILRRTGFFNEHGRFDSESRKIISAHGKKLSSVHVAWENEVKRKQEAAQSGPKSENLLADFVVIDENILFINRPPGYTLINWNLDKTTCAERIERHIHIFETLKSLSTPVKSPNWYK